jgi:hypothetical protein
VSDDLGELRRTPRRTLCGGYSINGYARF